MSDHVPSFLHCPGCGYRPDPADSEPYCHRCGVSFCPDSEFPCVPSEESDERSLLLWERERDILKGLL